jgi:hypothetical protein
LTGHEQMAFAIDRYVDLSFDALNRDLAWNLVRRKRLATKQNQTNDFKVFGLEEGHCLGTWQKRTKRLNVDWLARACVMDCHA